MKTKFTTNLKTKTDDELVEIYINAQDYNPDFISMVETELEFRNVSLIPLANMREIKNRTEEEMLVLGKQGNPFWMVVAFFLAFPGGIVGLIAGFHYAYSKQKSATGVQYFSYNKNTRIYGKAMLILGTILCVLTFMKFHFGIKI